LRMSKLPLGSGKIALSLAFAVCTLTAAGPGCRSSSSLGGASSLDLEEGASVRYVLAWSQEGVSPDGSFVTDMGYRVTIESGYIATVSMVLVPCDSSDEEGGSAALRWLSPRSAHADHAYDWDTSRVEGVVIEDVTSTSALQLGTAAASGASYCQAHWVAAAGQGIAEDGTYMASAVVLRATVESATGEMREVDTSTTLGAGALRDLETAETDLMTLLDAAPTEATITITRHPALALDGEDLSALSDEEIAYAFVRGLCASARVSAAVTPKY
jgi:hypothetical protein